MQSIPPSFAKANAWAFLQTLDKLLSVCAYMPFVGHAYKSLRSLGSQDPGDRKCIVKAKTTVDTYSKTRVQSQGKRERIEGNRCTVVHEYKGAKRRVKLTWKFGIVMIVKLVMAFLSA